VRIGGAGDDDASLDGELDLSSGTGKSAEQLIASRHLVIHGRSGHTLGLGRRKREVFPEFRGRFLCAAAIYSWWQWLGRAIPELYGVMEKRLVASPRTRSNHAAQPGLFCRRYEGRVDSRS
jgi:hypothetical protein